jgi:hypothetical protein
MQTGNQNTYSSRKFSDRKTNKPEALNSASSSDNVGHEGNKGTSMPQNESGAITGAYEQHSIGRKETRPLKMMNCPKCGKPIFNESFFGTPSGFKMRCPWCMATLKIIITPRIIAKIVADKSETN